MQAIHAIQNAMITTTTGAQAGMVVDAANAHRTYLRFERGVRPVSKRPHFGVSSSLSMPGGPIDLKQSIPSAIAGPDNGNDPGTTCHDHGNTWRFYNRQLPGAAWAMLVLSRSLCG